MGALPLILSLLAGAPAMSEADYEADIRRKLEAISLPALRAFDEASAAREADRLPEAEEGFRKVLELAPSFGPAHRRLSTVLARREQKREALEHAEKAVELEPIAASHVALAQVLGMDPAPDRPGSVRALEQALRLEPMDVYANYLRGVAALEASDLATARARLATLRQAAPDAWLTHQLAAFVELSSGNALTALDEAEAAAAKGGPAGLVDRIAEAGGTQLWLDRALRYGPRALLGWAVVLGALFVLGYALSQLQLALLTRRAQRGDPDHRQSTGEKALLGAYEAVILLTMVFFYVSIPLCVVLVFLTGGGIIYGFFALGRIPIKLVAIIAIATLASLYALVRGLFARAKDEDPGHLLAPEEQPELYRVAAEVAQKLSTRPVEAIYLTPGAEVAVTERGGFFRSLTGRGRRTLILGLAALEGMDQQQLKAILAHEYGHFINGDLKIGTLTHHVYLSLANMLQGMASVGRMAYGNPAYWMLRLFLRMYAMVTHGSGRMREVLADRAAAKRYGGGAFAQGLTHVIRKGALFDSACGQLLRDFVSPAGRMGNVYALIAAPEGKLAEAEDAARESLERTASAYDSHPPPAQRIAWTQHFAGEEVDPTPPPALQLVADRQALEETMAKEIDMRIRFYVAQVEAAQAAAAAAAA